MRNKKILFVWSADWPWDIRIEKEIISLKNKKANFDISILARNTSNRPFFEHMDGVAVYRLHKLFTNKKFDDIISTPIYINPIWFFEIFNTIKKVRPNIIIVRDIPLALSCIIIAKFFKIKVILDMAEHFPAAIKVNPKYINNPILKFLICNLNWYKHIEKYAVKWSDKIVVVVEESKERLINEYKISANKISIVSNTPLQNVIPIATNNKVYDEKKLKITYTGNVDGKFRGIHTIIETANLLKDNTNVEFNIVGDGIYLEEYKNKASKLKLKNINFLGRLPHKQLIEFLKSQNLGIVPHIKSDVIEYTIPNKIFDYMAQSLPVIVSSAKPLKRIVEETDCGYIFEAENAISLEKLIRKINLNREELVTKAQNGYQAIKNKYNWKNDEKNLIDIVNEYTVEK